MDGLHYYLIPLTGFSYSSMSGIRTCCKDDRHHNDRRTAGFIFNSQTVLWVAEVSALSISCVFCRLFQITFSRVLKVQTPCCT